MTNRLKIIGKEIQLALMLIAMISSIGLMIVGQHIYWTGFHNFDAAQNWRYIETEFGLNITEVMNDMSESSDMTELYIMGVNQNMIGHYVFGIGMLILGMSISEMLTKANTK